MRLFVGLPVPARMAQSLARHARATNLANARWTTPENLHVTLVFLGEVGEDKLPLVLHELEELREARFAIQLKQLGAFPRAGVLFPEGEPIPKLLQLQAQVAAAMERCGFALEQRPYHPHITLARLHHPVRLNPSQAALPAALQRSFAVDEVNVYRSHATANRSRYEVIGQKKADAPRREL